MPNDCKFAVLIDADNISDKYIKIILDEISKDGIATYKRIYGDWTKPALSSWKSILLDNSILPMQQYNYTTGKNSTDSALIIDAMDILYSGQVDGFCIVSSDSDFTRLAARLRESGMQVIGMGERKTPKSFISACNRFKYLDILFASAEEEKKKNTEKSAKPAKPEKLEKNEKLPGGKPVKSARTVDKPQPQMGNLETLKEAILSISEETSDEDGWIFIGTIGSLLVKRYPDFDVRNFGFSKQTPFIESLDLFDIKSVRTNDNSAKLIYVRPK